MVSDIGDYGGDIADWGGEIIIDRDIILDILVDIIRERGEIGDIVGDIPYYTQLVDVKIEGVAQRKGLAPSSKELAALRKALVERLSKGS